MDFEIFNQCIYQIIYESDNRKDFIGRNDQV